ncbi:MAG: hypothetical protein E6I91_10590 [Chloroflexi bacterium]|nr:MAG: hypothetical protein E6I91_10590 [Chloroflexota bacterium]
MLSPPGTQSQPVSSSTPGGHIQGPWLAVARGAWIVCALLLLANFVASIPAYYQLMLNVCTLPNHVPCTNPSQATPSWQLTPENVQALAQLHLSVAAYAAFFVTLNVVVSLLCWGIGLLIFWRKSDEGMGLFVSLLLVFFGAIGFNDTFLGAYVPAQSPLLLQILLYIIQNAAWAALGAFLLTFPTGRFVPRWSWLLISLWLGLNILYPDSLGWPPVLIAAELLLVLGATLGIMAYRYVRVLGASQRQQVKWFVYTVVVTFSLYIIINALPGLVPGLSVADSPYQLVFATSTTFIFAFYPLCLGIAILRYRLWDIDVIINRTLVYGSLTALLAVLYVGLVIGLQALVRLFTQQVSQSPVVIVASTLVIAALFQPLRYRIQRIIDRRFYRRKYNAARTLAQFSASLRNEVDLQQLREELLAVVQETMEPAHVSLWLRPVSPRERTELQPVLGREHSVDQLDV